MKPRNISRFWLRRLAESALFVSLIIIALFVWARFIPIGYRFTLGESITDIAALVSAVVCLISFVCCLWLPQKGTTIVASILYASLVAMVATVIYTSGELMSPFAGLWLVLAVFGGFFGGMMVIAMSLIVGLLATFTIIERGWHADIFISQILFGIIPLLLGLLLWHRQPDKKHDNSYSDLAHKLSNIEGKSDIVINAIDDGVLAISKSGIIELINPSAQTLVGWNQGDALGLSYQSVIKLVDRDGKEVPETTNPIAQALITNKPTHDDTLFILTTSEKKRLVSLMGSPVGQGDGVIVVFRDITREKAEEREQAEFISTASHEMRTPVASIEGYLGLALNPATANIDEKARDFITKAHESAQHLGRLFQDLLDVSKAEDGRLKSQPKVIDVSSFVGEIFEGLAPKASEKSLRYIFKPNPNLDESTDRQLHPVYFADVDPDHFREVVANLIENAIKYTPAGDVTVDVMGDEKLVTVSISDTGIGIPAEDIPHLFQKFYRVDNTDTREIGGTGLGLYLSRRLVEAMGGNLRLESEYKKGSTFFLDIPRISHEEAMDKLAQAAETPQEITPNPAPAINQAPASPAPSPVPSQPAGPTVVTPQAPTPIQPSVIPTPQPASQQAPQPPQPAPISTNPPSPPLESMSLADIEQSIAEQTRQLPPQPTDRQATVSIPPRQQPPA